MTLIHKQIILSIRVIDWKGLFSYNLRDSFTVEDLNLDYSGLLIPERGVSPDKPSVSFSFLINNNNFIYKKICLKTYLETKKTNLSACHHYLY